MSVEMRSIAPTGGAARHRTPKRVKRVGFSDPVYGGVMDFLIDEAEMLDANRLEDWLSLLSLEIFYWIPVRSSVMRKSGAGFDASMAFLFETIESISLRVKRNVKSGSAYADDPGTRTRRFVSNLVLHATDDPNEFAADTNLLLLRNRGDESIFEQIPARREDLIRRTPEGWRLAQRTVLLEQSVLGTPNMAIFL